MFLSMFLKDSFCYEENIKPLVPCSKLFQKALLEILKNWGHYTKLTPNDILVKKKDNWRFPWRQWYIRKLIPMELQILLNLNIFFNSCVSLYNVQTSKYISKLRVLTDSCLNCQRKKKKLKYNVEFSLKNSGLSESSTSLLNISPHQ